MTLRPPGYESQKIPAVIPAICCNQLRHKRLVRSSSCNVSCPDAIFDSFSPLVVPSARPVTVRDAEHGPAKSAQGTMIILIEDDMSEIHGVLTTGG